MDEMSAQEIQEILAEEARCLREGIPISEDLAKRIKDANVGIRNYTDDLKQSIAALGKSFGKAIVSTEKGAKRYNDMLQSGADAISNYTKKYGFAGKAAGLAIQGLSKYAQAVNKQSDQLWAAYEQMSKYGATGAQGMSGVFKNLQDFGYTVDEANQFGELVGASSADLAQFGGSVEKGLKKVAKMSNEIRNDDLGRQMQVMGMTPDAINQGITGYLKIQAVTGRTSKLNDEEMREGAKKYIMQQDKLAKITGASVKELEESRESALRERQYGARIRNLRAKAARGDKEAEKQADMLEETNQIMARQGPGVAKGFRDLSTGVMTSEESKQFARTFPETAKLIMSGTATTEQIMEMQRQEAKAGQPQIDAIRQVGTASKYFVKGIEQANIADTKAFKDREAAATAAQNVKDKGTEKLADMAIDQRNTALTADRVLNAGIETATTGMSNLAKIIDKITGIPSVVAPKVAPAGAENKAYGAGATPGATTAGGTQPSPGGAPSKTTAPSAPAAPSGAAPAKPMTKAEQSKQSLETQKGVLAKLTSAGITDKDAQSNILAQIEAESKGVAQSENLNYSAKRLLEVFPKYFKDMADAEKVASGGPEAIGNRIYGGRMGNAPNEGYKYRGRGLIQLTGKDNYAKYGKMIGVDLVADPDKANDPEIAQKLAVAYFQKAQERGVNLKNIKDVGKAVGYVDRGGKETEHRAQLAANIKNQTVQSAAKGGILTGPKSGYAATLHGTEAVVPLPGGDEIPADTPDLRGMMASNNEIIQAQIDKLVEFTKYLNNNINTSKKILQQSA